MTSKIIMKKVIGSNSKRQTHSNTTSEKYKSRIDQMLYQLYGLTEDEVKIVEGKND